MKFRRCALPLLAMASAFFGSDAWAAQPETVRKGERFYISIPLSYSVYREDAKKCGLPQDKVRCEGNGNLTICAYSQSACERAYIAESATEEKVVLFPNESKCAGVTLAGEWPVVLFSSLEECRKAERVSRDLVIERVSGTYGSKMIVKRNAR